MELFWLAGLIIFVAVYCLDRKVLKFDSEYYIYVTKLLVLLSVLSFVVRFTLGVFPPTPNHNYGHLLLVGWEDLVFSLLPIYYGRKYLHPKISTIVTVIASILFGLGHAYQGWFPVILLSFAPYFYSYKIGKKYGYGTSMALHVTYDVLIHTSTLLLAQLGLYV